MQNVIKSLVTTLVLSISAFSWADSEIKASIADQAFPAEHLTQLCLAALDSEAAYQATARKFDISKEARDRLVCNEMTLEEFTASHQLTEGNTIATVQ